MAEIHCVDRGKQWVALFKQRSDAFPRLRTGKITTLSSSPIGNPRAAPLPAPVSAPAAASRGAGGESRPAASRRGSQGAGGAGQAPRLSPEERLSAARREQAAERHPAVS